MWTTYYEDETSAPPAAVWSAIVDLHSGTPVGPESDQFELHGPFAVGTVVSVTPKGQDTMQSVITEIETDRVYADRTELGDVSLTFRHTLTPTADGGTRVRHTLEVGGVAGDIVGPELGPQISADFPTAMAELLTASVRRSNA